MLAATSTGCAAFRVKLEVIELSMNWTLVIQTLGITVTAILGILPYTSRLNIKKMKEELKLDLEIRDKMPPDSLDYLLVSARIKELVDALYMDSSKKRFHIYNWDDILIGVPLAAFSTYFTLMLIDDRNYWGMATAFMAVAGLGMIPDAFKPAKSSS